ncbi:hypothetical protein H4Q26_009081 [Puccinia striiformis f. sp. tritici PST-130]|nr:hypothetical protein H4Q26_009081 [Puccinia striiformis f. sp. tritici PST-130]
MRIMIQNSWSSACPSSEVMCLFTRPAGFRAGRNFLSSHPLGFRSRINQKTSTQELFWLGHAEPDLTDIKCWLQKNFAAARFSTQVPQSNLGNDEVVTEMRRVAKVVRRGPNTTTKADGTTKQEKPVTQLETRTRATNLEWLFDESSGYEVTRRVLRFQLVARNDRDDIINIELLRAAQPFSIDRL